MGDAVGRLTVRAGRTWEACEPYQRAAVIAALLVILASVGPFSFADAALALTGAAVICLVAARAEGWALELPIGDRALLLASAAWGSGLVVVRLLDRPLGLTLLALIGIAGLVAAGMLGRHDPASSRPSSSELPASHAGSVRWLNREPPRDSESA